VSYASYVVNVYLQNECSLASRGSSEQETCGCLLEGAGRVESFRSARLEADPSPLRRALSSYLNKHGKSTFESKEQKSGN
jgi:hypothetical protein